MNSLKCIKTMKSSSTKNLPKKYLTLHLHSNCHETKAPVLIHFALLYPLILDNDRLLRTKGHPDFKDEIL